MAQLYPSNTDLSNLVDAEQRVAHKLLKNLDDSWFVVPQVTITHKGDDAEIDFVILSPDFGLFCVEVKGGLITLADGKWKSYNIPLDDPIDQVMRAKHSLLKRLKKSKVDVAQFRVNHFVAFPDIADFPAEGAGPNGPREIIMTGPELDFPQQAIEHMQKDKGSPLTTPEMVSILKALRPDVRDVQVDGRYVVGVSQRIEKVTTSNLGILFPLDINRRIYVEGAAGTGKTYLAHYWATRAVQRGEKTLFVCYNRALGVELYNRLKQTMGEAELKELLVVGPFHSVANLLLGDKQPQVTEDADQEFWDARHAQLLLEHRDSISQRFDTIVVDEGQDFLPLWFEALESLLSDSPTNRMYVTTDPKQAIFAPPLEIPIDATRIPLKRNIRNTRRIGNLVSALGGAKVSPGASAGPGIDIFSCGGAKERRKKIAAALRTAHEELEIPLSQILVAVPHRSDVAELTLGPVGDFVLVPWNERTEEAVACGTIQGTKGLERLAVIVSSMDEEPNPGLTYVGTSRAVVYLAVVGSDQFIAQVRPPNRNQLPRESSSSDVSLGN